MEGALVDMQLVPTCTSSTGSVITPACVMGMRGLTRGRWEDAARRDMTYQCHMYTVT